MGSMPKSKTIPSPPQPETVKYTDAEAKQVRDSAKAVAAGKFGVSGTNLTRNMLTSASVEAKRKRLGGD